MQRNHANGGPVRSVRCHQQHYTGYVSCPPMLSVCLLQTAEAEGQILTSQITKVKSCISEHIAEYPFEVHFTNAKGSPWLLCTATEVRCALCLLCHLFVCTICMPSSV